jgi:YesN/AraC family two-component response regulator
VSTIDIYLHSVFRDNTKEKERFKNLFSNLNKSQLIYPVKMYNPNYNDSGMLYIVPLSPIKQSGSYGVVIFTINMDYFTKNLESLCTNKEASAFIIDSNNKVISKYSHNSNIEINDIMEIMQNNEPSTFKSSDKNLNLINNHINFWVYNDNIGFNYFLSLPSSIIYKELNVTLIVILISIIVIIGLEILLSRYFSKKNSQPVQNIMTTILKKLDFIPETDSYTDEYETIEFLIQQIIEEEKETKENLLLHKPQLVSSYLKQLIAGNYPQNEILMKLKKLGVNFDYQIFTVMLLGSTKASQDFATYKQDLLDLSNDNLKVYCLQYRSYLCLILNALNERDIYNFTLQINELLGKNNYKDINCSIGSNCNDASNLKKIYEQALIAMHAHIVDNNSKVNVYTKQSSEEKQFVYSTEIEKHFSAVLKSGNAKEAKEIIESLLKKNIETTYTTSSIMSLYQYIYLTCIRTVSELNLDINLPIFPEFLRDLTVSQIKQRLILIVEDITKLTLSKIEEKSHKLKTDIIDFIDNHYDNPDLSLESISQHFNLSIYTISRFFNKAFNMHFLDYLNTLRIEKAKKLLQNNRYRINQIPNKVGYTNDVTFRRCFKRITGMTPNQYRSFKKENIV